jgi:putative N6-adenine-specific DNA methylase
MMKCMCIGYRGSEKVMQSEIRELIKAESQAEDTVAVFDADEKDLCRLCYIGQSFFKAAQLLGSFGIRKLDDVKTDIDYGFLRGKKFRVDCDRAGEHDFKSVDVEQALGEFIYEKTKARVEFKNPDVIVLVYIYNKKCYIGIDYSGIDLGKRDYKVYLHPKAMKGIAGYLMLRLAGYDKHKILLDPFCGSGVIPVEAAFYATGFPVNAFRKEKLQCVKMGACTSEYLEQFDDKKEFSGKIFGFDKELRHITAAKQNAKIGGVGKFISFSRVSVDWLETKFKEGEVGLIVTDAPFMTKWNEKQVKKIYEEFFYQADYILDKEGKIAIIVNNAIKDVAEKKGFLLEDEITIEKKKHELNIGIFKKANI